MVTCNVSVNGGPRRNHVTQQESVPANTSTWVLFLSCLSTATHHALCHMDIFKIHTNTSTTSRHNNGGSDICGRGHAYNLPFRPPHRNQSLTSAKDTTGPEAPVRASAVWDSTMGVHHQRRILRVARRNGHGSKPRSRFHRVKAAYEIRGKLIRVRLSCGRDKNPWGILVGIPRASPRSVRQQQ